MKPEGSLGEGASQRQVGSPDREFIGEVTPVFCAHEPDLGHTIVEFSEVSSPFSAILSAGLGVGGFHFHAPRWWLLPTRAFTSSPVLPDASVSPDMCV